MHRTYITRRVQTSPRENPPELPPLEVFKTARQGINHETLIGYRTENPLDQKQYILFLRHSLPFYCINTICQSLLNPPSFVPILNPMCHLCISTISSAKALISPCNGSFKRSLINIKNKVAERTDPCGTPTFIYFPHSCNSISSLFEAYFLSMNETSFLPCLLLALIL